jgi:hypothetical protein
MTKVLDKYGNVKYSNTGVISQVITDGVVDKAPSEDAVFDALALKVNTTDLPSNLTLYPTTAASDIGGYSKLATTIDDPDYDSPAVDVTTGSITGTGQLIASLATTSGQLTGNPDVINISTVGNIRKTAGSGSAQFYYEVYHRTSGGTETLVATSDLTTLVSSATYIEFSASALLNNGTWLSTDRIVLKFYGSKVGFGSNPTFDFQFGGSTPVRTVMPVPASVIVDLPITIDSTSINNGTASTLLRNEGGKVGDTDYTVPKTDGTSGQVLQTNGAGVVTWATIASGITIGTTPITSGTDGRVLFQAGGVVQQDSTLFWDNTNKRLGVGATPSSSVRLDVRVQGALSTDLAFRVRNSANTDNLLSVSGNGQSILGINASSSPTVILDPSGSVRLLLRGGTNNSISLNNSAANILESENRGWDIANGTGNCRIRTSMQYAILNQGSFQLNVTGAKTSGTATNSILIENGVAPVTNIADNSWMYSADITAGNAAPHFRTENGSIIKLYQETTGVAAATLVSGGGTALTDTDTFDGYTLKKIVKALRNNGLLA